MSQVSVIMPTLNERGNIVPLVRAIRHELRGLAHEVLVVDDHSSDGTAQAVLDLQDPHVRVLIRTEDQGFAKSIRQGIEQAKGDLLIIMDSDFNHDPRYLPEMVARLAVYDCVSGSRFLKGGRMVPAWRGIASRLFNAFVCMMTGGTMTDHLFGFFGVRREALAGCSFDDIFSGFGDYGIRLLCCLQQHRAKILEFPAVCGARLSGRGNQRYVRTLGQYVKTTFALARRGRVT